MWLSRCMKKPFEGLFGPTKRPALPYPLTVREALARERLGTERLVPPSLWPASEERIKTQEPVNLPVHQPAWEELALIQLSLLPSSPFISKKGWFSCFDLINTEWVKKPPSAIDQKEEEEEGSPKKEKEKTKRSDFYGENDSAKENGRSERSDDWIHGLSEDQIEEIKQGEACCALDESLHEQNRIENDDICNQNTQKEENEIKGNDQTERKREQNRRRRQAQHERRKEGRMKRREEHAKQKEMEERESWVQETVKEERDKINSEASAEEQTRETEDRIETEEICGLESAEKEDERRKNDKTERRREKNRRRRQAQRERRKEGRMHRIEEDDKDKEE